MSWITRLRDAWAASAEPEASPAKAGAEETSGWLITTRPHSVTASLEKPPAVPDLTGAVRGRLFIVGPGWLDPDHLPE